jgi:hypothetical protein
MLGGVQTSELENGELVVHTRQHSYFSRLADAETFQRLASVETQRRGVEEAGAVAAVTDGSEWIQKFVDHHSYRALRILDFPHASGQIHAVGKPIGAKAVPRRRRGWRSNCMSSRKTGRRRSCMRCGVWWASRRSTANWRRTWLTWRSVRCTRGTQPFRRPVGRSVTAPLKAPKNWWSKRI